MTSGCNPSNSGYDDSGEVILITGTKAIRSCCFDNSNCKQITGWQNGSLTFKSFLQIDIKSPGQAHGVDMLNLEIKSSHEFRMVS